MKQSYLSDISGHIHLMMELQVLMIMVVMDILIKMGNGLIMKNINKIIIPIITMKQNVGTH